MANFAEDLATWIWRRGMAMGNGVGISWRKYHLEHWTQSESSAFNAEVSHMPTRTPFTFFLPPFIVKNIRGKQLFNGVIRHATCSVCRSFLPSRKRCRDQLFCALLHWSSSWASPGYFQHRFLKMRGSPTFQLHSCRKSRTKKNGSSGTCRTPANC